MLEALAINAALIGGAMLALWLVAVRLGDVSFIDAVWGLGMAFLALTSWSQLDDAGIRASLIAALAAAWGLRLGLHLFTRWQAHGEDARYAALLGKAKEQGRFASAALGLVFAPQAVLLFVTCLPAQLGILAPPSPLC